MINSNYSDINPDYIPDECEWHVIDKQLLIKNGPTSLRDGNRLQDTTCSTKDIQRYPQRSLVEGEDLMFELSAEYFSFETKILFKIL